MRRNMCCGENMGSFSSGAAGLYDPQIGTAGHPGIYCDRSLVPDPAEKVALCGWRITDLISDLRTGLYRNIIFRFYPHYKDSMFDNGQLSYVNIAKCLAVLILCLIYWKDSVQENRRNRYYFYLNLAGLVLYSCGSFPEVSRVAYYLIQSQIFLIPGVLKDARKGWFRTLCIIGVVAAYLLYFVMLLRGMYDVEIRLLPYLNWIFN